MLRGGVHLRPKEILVQVKLYSEARARNLVAMMELFFGLGE